jgi:branched-chain amino acid transport system ATP-binding protein
MLNVSNLFSVYGAIKAVRDISIEVPKGHMVALIGANGAGKSTALNTIAGLHKPFSGSIKLNNLEISNLPPHAIVRKGLALVPEGRKIIAPLTVRDNLGLNTYAKRGSFPEMRDRVFSLFPRLAERLDQVAGSLSGGEQQMLAISRALMTNPDIILLDEPSMGLASSVIDKVYDAIVTIHKQGLSILLVEQNAELALAVSNFTYVLQRGEIVLEGPSSELSEDPILINKYLG